MRFMDHFEEITEPKLNTDYSVSGSKIIDTLDCMMDEEGSTAACEQSVTISYKTVCNIRPRGYGVTVNQRLMVRGRGVQSRYSCTAVCCASS
jgi:hypothetical protein